MKQRALRPALACAALTALLLFTLSPVSAKEYDLSPALDILAAERTMKKCTVKNGSLRFSASDFEQTVGRTVAYVTVTSLPDAALGVLKYAGADVFESQSFPRRNLTLLRFVPHRDAVGVCSFGFTANGDDPERPVLCTVSVLETLNLAPQARNANYEAICGVSVVKPFPAGDPEGDAVTYEVTSYPKKGALRVSDDGVFTYTPAGVFRGKDSFSYRAVDAYGNRSAQATVRLRVEKPACDAVYEDMRTHWGGVAAMKMTAKGLMRGTEKDGKLYFRPDEPVTRGDFLAMAMIVAGLEEKVSLGSAAVFADDASIPQNIRGYAETAAAMGVVGGYASTEGDAEFRSGDPVTRAQAAVILSRLLDEDNVPAARVFLDTASIPAWARAPMNTLTALGIFNGTASGALLPDAPLTRAQAAELLCRTEQYLANQ